MDPKKLSWKLLQPDPCSCQLSQLAHGELKEDKSVVDLVIWDVWVNKAADNWFCCFQEVGLFLAPVGAVISHPVMARGGSAWAGRYFYRSPLASLSTLPSSSLWLKRSLCWMLAGLRFVPALCRRAQLRTPAALCCVVFWQSVTEQRQQLKWMSSRAKRRHVSFCLKGPEGGPQQVDTQSAAGLSELPLDPVNMLGSQN